MKFLLGSIVLFALAYLYYWHPVRQAVKISLEIIATTVPYEQRPENPTRKILIAGDSTAYGTGAKNSKDSIAGRIGAKYPDARITNVSVNGLRLEGLNELLEKQSGETYDLILFQIGANDVTGFTKRTDVRRELEKAVAFAEARASVVILVTAGNVGLAPIFKPPATQLLSWRTRVVREIFMEVAALRPAVTYVDLYVTKENDVFGTDIEKYYAADRFHPSGAGYGVWFTDIETVLEAQLGE